MGHGLRWLLGAGVVLALSALPAEAQVRIGVGINIGSPPVYVAPYYEPYYYPPARVFQGRPYYRPVYYDRFDRQYRRDVEKARREYRRDVREARRDYERDRRNVRRRR